MTDRDPLFVTVPEAARRLGISEKSVYRLLNSGSLSLVEFDGMSGTKRIAYAQLKAWAHDQIKRGVPG